MEGIIIKWNNINPKMRIPKPNMMNGLHINSNGTKRWYLNDKRHRTDGPAAEYANGIKEWWLNGQFLGDDDDGFWALWEFLTDDQRNNLSLLMHLPKI